MAYSTQTGGQFLLAHSCRPSALTTQSCPFVCVCILSVFFMNGSVCYFAYFLVPVVSLIVSTSAVSCLKTSIMTHYAA